jgi:uncharacterized protein YyaL (SSP411 family)
MPLLRDIKERCSSPYLIQHADNPVDWQTWDDEAFELARALDRPLFISIGYASCHWCHVMAHESFEDEATAELINRAFVPIKVDREERPDVDQLYMTATQAVSGHGGWPMSVFATPDGRPFYAGTYFPPSDRGGMPGFSHVLRSLEGAWMAQRSKVEEQADSLLEAVRKEATFLDTMVQRSPEPLIFSSVLDRLIDELSKRFDQLDGGFGGAPKFPRPSYVEACLVHHAKTGDPQGLAMATTTLDAMAAGGIYDHLAGGFARYAVDQTWTVPHFEKMLSDQALLARCYLHAFQLTGNPSYAQVARETFDWVLDELSLPQGGYASSVDADADGHEGSHAVFSPAQIADALAGEPGALSPKGACDFYSVSAEGSFEHGASVLARRRGPQTRSLPEEATRAALLRTRRRRPQPAIDDKVLLEWNALFASCLAEAAGSMGDERWALEAARLVGQLERTFSTQNGRLARSARQGRADHLAMLGDYAWLIDAETRLFELEGDGAWLERAQQRAHEMIELFWDGEVPRAHQVDVGRGFFSTGRDARALVVRAKELFDGALPSASSVAATALARLAQLLGDRDLAAVAQRQVELATPILREQPTAVPDLVAALGWLVDSVEIALPGGPDALLDAVRTMAIPFGIVAFGNDPRCGLLAGREPGLAYVCRLGVCEQPVSELDELVEGIAASVRA